MTAFAVVLAPHESLVTSHLLGRIGSALEAVTGARAGLTSSGSCALLLSPLHSSDPARPIVHPLSHVAVTGQVLLEDRRALIERLDLDRDASDLEIVAAALQDLIADSWKIQTALVHGDYSPKNMLVRREKIFLIDFEVIHWGDPAFDSGFLLNHLFLKAFHQRSVAEIFIEAAREFWNSRPPGRPTPIAPAP